MEERRWKPNPIILSQSFFFFFEPGMNKTYNKPNSEYLSNLIHVKSYTNWKKEKNKPNKPYNQIVAYRAKLLAFWDRCIAQF